MPAITVRNLSDETHRALKQRAASHGRSTEAEVRAILDEAARPQLGLGRTLRGIGRAHGITDADVDALETARDRDPATPMSFEP